MNITEIRKYIISSISNVYEANEAESISYLIFEDVLKRSKTDIILKGADLVTTDETDKISKIIEELKNNKPIQYILGYADFYDLKFAVNEYTLIPRQETEILVNEIIKYNKQFKNIKIIDIGTGTGCIAISLAKNINANITALDISNEALQIAQNNAKMNNVSLNFLNLNILENNLNSDFLFDVIVSNPPYVTNTEKQFMHENVLNYEPNSALFVDDSNPLLFYKSILQFAEKNLVTGGQIWFEINEKFGTDILELLKKHNFTNIKIIKDLNEKERIAFGTKNK
jgi:release factor glutamine methyltransferase